MEEFKLKLLDALSDDVIIQRYQKIFEKCFKTSTEAITELQKTMVISNNELRSREKRIQDLELQNTGLWERLDELERCSRKPSVRVFGIPETTHCTTDTKLLELINKNMKLQPPLEPGNIEVSHRIGKTPAPPNDNQAANSSRSQTRPRPIIARFASRRIKVRVMEVKKRLKRNRQSDDSADQEEEDEDLSASFPGPFIHIGWSHTAASAFGKEGPRYEECKAVIRYVGFWW